MNKGNHYLPAVLYTFLLLAMWVASWFIGVAELLMSGRNTMNSLLSDEGVRWALREALPCLESAPWGVAMLLLVAAGFLNGSGLLDTLHSLALMRPLSENRRYAALMSFAVLCVVFALLFMMSVAPWGILDGITPDWNTHPLVDGIVPLLFFAIAATSIMHGVVYGSYRSVSDIAKGVCHTVALFVPALVAFIPASGIISCTEYMGIFPLFGVDSNGPIVMEYVLYLLPFIYLMPSLFHGNDI